MTAHAQTSTIQPSHRRALAAALFMPPTAVLANLEIAYALVPAACASRNTLVLHVVNALWFAFAIAGALLAWRSRKAAGGAGSEEDGSPLARIRFLAGIALMLGAMSLLVIAAQWIAVFILDPCQ